jgi:hypothetical protein
MLLIGESLPDHLREKYAPAPNPRTVLMNAARNLGLTVRSRSSSVVFRHGPSMSRMVC